jgi:hypothetical protein
MWRIRLRRPTFQACADTNARAKQVASSRAWAPLTDLAAPIVAGLAMFTVAVMLVLAVWYLSGSGGFGSLPAYSLALTNASVFITISLATGLVLLGSTGFSGGGWSWCCGMSSPSGRARTTR